MIEDKLLVVETLRGHFHDLIDRVGEPDALDQLLVGLVGGLALGTIGVGLVR